MKYVVSIEIDGKRLYYCHRVGFLRDDFVESIYDATLYADEAKAKKVRHYIRADWKPQFVAATCEILPVKIELAVEEKGE